MKRVEKRRVLELINDSDNGSMRIWRSTTEIDFDNLLDINNQLALVINKNIDQGNYKSNIIGLGLRNNFAYGYHYLSINSSEYINKFTLPGVNRNYKFRNINKKSGLGYEYLLNRDQDSKLNLFSNLNLS